MVIFFLEHAGELPIIALRRERSFHNTHTHPHTLGHFVNTSTQQREKKHF
uniref:Uncharacterized protein n=1 Tax=Arundo donax TaxID=35708 RepID=A0A0A8XRI4_ARUDO